MDAAPAKALAAFGFLTVLESAEHGLFGGYLVPVELFPPALRGLADWLPFRYQVGLPVEIATSAHAREAALRLLGAQWCWVAVTAGAAHLLWRRGLARFAAYGG